MLVYASVAVARITSVDVFFFNDTATTEIYTLSLHDALPIWVAPQAATAISAPKGNNTVNPPDRKSTRLNSSHTVISYAVFCLKKKKKRQKQINNNKKRSKNNNKTT